jgi:hypothetical protein
MASYTDAMNKFTQAATAFMDHVHLLTEARDAYQMAITASASLRTSLDAGDRALRSLMTQMELVVDAHLRGPALDTRKLEALKPEMLKVEAIRSNGESAATGLKFPSVKTVAFRFPGLGTVFLPPHLILECPVVRIRRCNRLACASMQTDNGVG